MQSRSYPNLPGTFESGNFRVRLNKFHGRKEINLVYNEKVIATFSAAELLDLEEVITQMSLFITDECYAKLPPDDD